jgi:hypothetical protein
VILETVLLTTRSKRLQTHNLILKDVENRGEWKGKGVLIALRVSIGGTGVEKTLDVLMSFQC